ncbi:hypothetical protein [Stackebrandtia soli]|uniref:hypothetical protein n=1 Tax=Stackebrandtia soli TaxID=1892856 RepID=UPI0039EB0382
MYDDNAWPDTAPISVFIAERKRPQRVLAAAVALGAAAAFHLLAAALYGTAVIKSPDAVVLSEQIATWVMVVVSVLVGSATATIVVGLLRGRRWAPLGGRVAGGVYAVSCGFFGLSAMPPSGTASAGFTWFYAVVAFVIAVAGVVALLCLFGRSVDEYFAPPQQQQATPFAPTGPDVQPLGGYDRDWIPPAQHEPPRDQRQQYPPFGQ